MFEPARQSCRLISESAGHKTLAHISICLSVCMCVRCVRCERWVRGAVRRCGASVGAVRASKRASVHPCVRASVRACVHACVRVHPLLGANNPSRNWRQINRQRQFAAKPARRDFEPARHLRSGGGCSHPDLLDYPAALLIQYN